MIAWLFQSMIEVQRDIYLAFAERIKLYAETGDWSQLAVFPSMGIVFGAVHAMTPGHSKTLLAAYSVGIPASTWRALGTAFLLSAVHISMSVIIVILSLPLVSVILGSVGRAPALEMLSRGLLALRARACRGCSKDESESCALPCRRNRSRPESYCSSLPGRSYDLALQSTHEVRAP